MTSSASPTPLTNVAAFWLIATIMLGGVFQPASGSFVLGPTSRYWRCSPISSAFEVWMIWRRIFQAVPSIIKSCYEIATHPDARLTDVRRIHIKGRHTRDASGISGSPSFGANSERILNMVEVDLADGPYELVGGSNGTAELSQDEEGENIPKAQTLERLRIVNFMWLAMMKMLAYCIITSRAMNAPSGSQKYRELCDIRDDITKRYEFYQRIVHEMNEGWRFRLGVCLPVLAQFMKVMMVQGITFPKILAVIYFGHWLLLELLLTLASSCCCNSKDLVMNVDAYLSESYRSFENDEWASADARQASLGENTNQDSRSNESDVTVREAASDNPPAEIQRELERWPFDQWEDGLTISHVVVIIKLVHGLCAFSQDKQIAFSMPLDKALLAFALAIASFLYLISFPQLILTKGQRGRMIRLSRRTKFDRRRSNRRENAPIIGGYIVGGKLGIVGLIWWLFYCLAFYDSEGTNRPSWPWLDILG